MRILVKRIRLLALIIMTIDFGNIAIQANSNPNLFVDSGISEPDLGQTSFDSEISLLNKTFHLVSHGRPGELLINNSWLDQVDIGNWIEANYNNVEINHINIYGCNFAKGEKGKQAVSYLEEALGVSIAASDDVTGIDGDWDLEVGTARDVLSIPNFKSNLQCVPGGTADTDDYDGDGVCNIDDLDDDNDGILDLDEGGCSSGTAGAGAGAGDPFESAFNNNPDYIDGSYHGAVYKESEGSFYVSGVMANVDLTDALTPVEVIPANGYNYTGTPLFLETGGSGNIERGGYVLITTDGIYAWGDRTNTGSGAATPSNAFQQISLPPGVTSTGSIVNLNVSNGATAIVTASGEVYMSSAKTLYKAAIGNAGATSINTWFQTMIDASTPLTGVYDFFDHCGTNGFAYDSDNNTFYTWGMLSFLGDGSAELRREYATPMVNPLPAGVDVVQIQVGNFANKAAYSVLGSDGRIYVLGENASGVLGQGNTTDLRTWGVMKDPTGAGDMTDVTYISTSKDENSNRTFTNMLTSDGTLYVVGNQDSGETSVASTTLPALAQGSVLGEEVYYVNAGGHFSSAIIEGSTDVCHTGHNDAGVFGDGTTADRDMYECNPLVGFSIETVCTPVDTDGDGIADQFDLDSDDDGCPDAIEGGGSFVQGDLTTDDNLCNTTSCVDADGVPTNTGSPQTIGDSQDASVQSADCPCTDPNLYADNCDFDGDGILNGDDLDDDNDGILDTDEAINNENCIYSFTDFQISPEDETSSFEIVNSSGTVVATGTLEVIIPSGSPGFTEVEIKASTAEDDFADPGSYLGFESNGGASTNNSNPLEYRITITGIAGLGLPPGELFFNGKSRTGIGYNNFRDFEIETTGPRTSIVFGASGITDVATGSTLSDGSVIAQDQILRSGYGRMNETNIDFPYFTIAYEHGAITDTNPFVFSFIKRDHGIGDDVFARESHDIWMTCDSDTDGDGIADQFDLDSDDDGCPDAIEGGGSFVQGDLTTDDNLCNTTSCVDADGVPTNTGSPQTIGDSQDASESSACPVPCTDPNLYADNCDFDGDGILNGDDLDDDNDGILDVDEASCGFHETTNGISGGSTGNRTASADFIFDGNTYGFNFVSNIDHGTAFGTDFTNGFHWGSYEFGTDFNSSYTLNVPIASSINLEAYVGPSVLQNNAQFANNMKSHTIVPTWGGGVVGRIHDPANETSLTDGAIISSGTSFTTIVGVPTDLSWRIEFDLSGFVGTFNVNLNTSVSSGAFGYAGYGFNVISCEGMDTDGDGVPNHLDTDSDNDGCFDAFESGKKSTNEESFTGTVGSNGYDDSLETSPDSGEELNFADLSSVTNSAISPCSTTEICGDGYDNDFDGLVDAYDSDCSGAPCFEPNTMITPLDVAAQIQWQSSFTEFDITNAPIIGDIDNDGVTEILVVSSAGDVYAFKGDGSNLTTASPIISGIKVRGHTALAIGDLDDDGTSEIVGIGEDDYVYVFEHTGGDISGAYAFKADKATEFIAGGPRISDIDEDGVPEIITGLDVYKLDYSSGIMTKVTNYSHPYSSVSGGAEGFQNTVISIDILPSSECALCGGKELVTHDKVYVVNWQTGELEVVRDVLNLDPSYSTNNSNTKCAIGDVNLDGVIDIVAAGLVWTPETNTILFESVDLKNRRGQPAIGNFYDDTQDGHSVDLPDIVFTGPTTKWAAVNYNYASASTPYRLWSVGGLDASANTNVTLFDFNGDGIQELMHRGDGQMGVYNGNASSPILLESLTGKSATWYEYISIADVDNDDQAELVAVAGLVTNASVGQLRVYESGNSVMWEDARNIWNQRDYMIYAINDDLSIPIQQQNSSVEIPINSGTYNLNVFDTQVNPNYATVPAGSVECSSCDLADATADCDGDGVPNGQDCDPEDATNTYVVGADTDGDGVEDCEEVNPTDPTVTPTDPENACDYPGYVSVDSDGDGWSDCEETTGNDDSATTGDPAGVTSDPNCDQSTPLDPTGVCCDPTDATADCDGDGVPNGQDCDPEDATNTYVVGADTDGDGVEDCEEVNPTDPTVTPTDPENACDYPGYVSVDSDGDGWSDCEETTGNDDSATTGDPAGVTSDPNCDQSTPLDPTGVCCDPTDATADCDGDGVPNGQDCDPEDATNTYVVGADTDGDGVEDCEEVNPTDPTVTPTDPNNACDYPGYVSVDSDGDGWSDCEETTGNNDITTPGDPGGVTSDPNCDQSTPLNPGGECCDLADPLDDCDGDGVTNGQDCDPEDATNAYMVGADTDGDGVDDCEEVDPTDPTVTPTDPNNACDYPGYVSVDSDGDGWSDCEETTGNNDITTPGDPGGVTSDPNCDQSTPLNPGGECCDLADPLDDCDGDGVTNGQDCDPEDAMNAYMVGVDSDGDGVDDCEEVDPTDPTVTPTDPNNACDYPGYVSVDSDGDGWSDCEETTGNNDITTPGDPGGVTSDPNCDQSTPLNPGGECCDLADPLDDCDGDGVTNGQDCDPEDATNAYMVGADTDGDGVDDCEEVDPTDPTVTPTDPNNACDYPGYVSVDSDGDGWSDCEETTGNNDITTPGDPGGVTSDPNCDQSTPLNPGGECCDLADPLDDCDGDGVTNGQDCDPEDAMNAYMVGVDSDGDGVDDCEEVDPTDPTVTPTDPNNACDYPGYVSVDSDGDGWSDCEETTGNNDITTPGDPGGVTSDPNCDQSTPLNPTGVCIPCEPITDPGYVTSSSVSTDVGGQAAFTLSSYEGADAISWEIFPNLGVSPSIGTGSYTGLVTFTIAGEYTVTYTLENTTNPEGCSTPAFATATNTFVVNELPNACEQPSATSVSVDPTSGAIPVGGTADFTLNGGEPNTQIQWRLIPATGVSPAAGSGSNTGDITFSNVGVYTIVYTIINEGDLTCDPVQISATSQVAVGIDPCTPPSELFVLSSQDLGEVYVGDVVSFAASGGLPGSLTWEVTPNNSVSPSNGTGSTTGDLTVLEPGLITVTFTSINSTSPLNCTAPAVVSKSITFEAIDPCTEGYVGDLSNTTSLWYLADCDGDGVPNGVELDPDGDGTDNGNGTDPNDACDYEVDLQDYSSVSDDWKSADCDGDGVTNGKEVDPDGNGVLGGTGTNGGTTDPTDPCDYNDGDQSLTMSTEWDALDCDDDGNPNTEDPNPQDPTVEDDEDSTSPETPVTVNVLENDDYLANGDSNNKGTTVITDFGTGTATGVVSINSETGEITYTPAEGEENTSVTIDYQVCNTDPDPDVCSTATLTINITVSCLTINTTVYLEGPYVDNGSNGVMTTKLNDLGYLPGQDPVTFFGAETPAGQPYDVAPWNYGGAEGDNYDYQLSGRDGSAGYSANTTDWVLVSLRTGVGSESTVCTRAALLMNDGTVVMVEGFECCDLNVNSSYYIVVEHRNHLTVMSHEAVAPVNGVINYDFTDQQSYRSLFGFGQKFIAGNYVMYAGNSDQTNSSTSDTDINVKDKDFWLIENGDNSSYYFNDLELNGDVNVQDKNLWYENNGKFSDVPRDE